MVLINDKKFACATCIKGHRVSGCTHTDRPLFEVKKKGRPATQCQFCREKRKGGQSSGSVHTKCACGELKNQTPSTIMPGQAGPSVTAAAKGSPPVPQKSQSPQVQPPPKDTPGSTSNPEIVETRKGQPGSHATYPNGLRDVHEMAAAAEALTGLGGETNQAAERKLSSLLNPCNCQTTGRCRCCAPKRSGRDLLLEHARTKSPNGDHGQVTDSLIEMFKAKATTRSDGGGSNSSGSTTPTSSFNRLANLSMTSTKLASPDNRHHPAHTSPHVHKVRLYSPYSNGTASPRPGKQRSESISSQSGGRGARPPPRIRPLSDMNTFLGAVFNEDGSVASEIPRSALGLPGIASFDKAAIDGRVKVESMAMDTDQPVSFPTSEDVVIGACTCGEGCECPNCATHGNRPSTSPPNGDHHHHDGCGSKCTSGFDCANHLSIPSGVTSIEHLIQIAAANVPPNPSRSTRDLNPLDTGVLPPAAHMSEDAAQAFGIVQLRPLECCNGRCQCKPGECKCESDCCGCCESCNCGDDGDTVMGDSTASAAGGCCGSGSNETVTSSVANSPSNASATSSLSHRQPSPAPPMTPGCHSNVRRTSSASRAKDTAVDGRRSSVGDRSGVAVQRSTSLGSKTVAKAPLALAQTLHPRPILPKPSSSGSGCGKSSADRLAPPRSCSGGSRQPSPVHRGSFSSSQASCCSSPTTAPANVQTPTDVSPLPPAAAASTEDTIGDNASAGMSVGVNEIANALAASDVDFMSYLNSLMPAANDDGDHHQQPQHPPPQQQPQQLPTPTPTQPQPQPTHPHHQHRASEHDVQHPSSTAAEASTASHMTSPTDITMFSHPSPRGPHMEQHSIGDIQSMIAGALAQQGMIPRPDTHGEQQVHDYGYLFNMQGSASHQPMQHPAPNAGDAGNLYFNFNAGAPGPAHPSATALGGMPVPQPAHTSDPAGSNQAFFKPDANLYYPNYGAGFSHPIPMLQPSQGSSHSQQMPQVTAQSVASAVAAVAAGNHQQQHHPGMPVNPDIIDLSKPLNPTDVDRILQALLSQQARQQGVGDAVAPGTVEPPPVSSVPVAPPLQHTPQSTNGQPAPESAAGAPVVNEVFDVFSADYLDRAW